MSEEWRWTRLCAAAFAMLLVTAGLAGCGRAGALEPPPDPSVPAAAAGAEQPDAIPLRPKRVPIAKPNEPFLLDPLL